MCKRLLQLKEYITILRNQNQIPVAICLTDPQWGIISEMAQLLEPFMIIQQMMEGEKYVTISLVPYLVWKVRQHLLQNLEDREEPDERSEHFKTINRKMLVDFNERWGSGLPETVYAEHETEGPRNRSKGLTKLQMFASYLDPRMKKLSPHFPIPDRVLLRAAFREYVVQVELDKAQTPVGDAQQPPQQGQNAPPQQLGRRRQREGPVGAQHRRNIAGVMADLSDEDDNEHEGVVAPLAIDRRAIEAIVDIQIRQFEREPKLHFWTEVDDEGLPVEGAEYNNPLEWWKGRCALYPALAPIAKIILSIPASSAPAERLFSHAGLTIAKDRNRLCPDVATDLIFLHDAYPLVFPELMP